MSSLVVSLQGQPVELTPGLRYELWLKGPDLILRVGTVVPPPVGCLAEIVFLDGWRITTTSLSSAASVTQNGQPLSTSSNVFPARGELQLTAPLASPPLAATPVMPATAPAPITPGYPATPSPVPGGLGAAGYNAAGASAPVILAARNNDTDFVAAIRTCLRKYSDFTGRASRAEYWYWTLGVVLAYVALGTFSLIVGVLSAGLGTVALILGVLTVAFGTLVPGLAVGVRRLHDTGKPGVYQLFSLIPFVGPFVVLVFMVAEGTPGPNPYGAVPRPLSAPGATAAPRDLPLPFGMTLESAGAGSPNVTVVDVTAGGPADLAGVNVGSILNALDGVPVTDPTDAPRVLAGKRLGDATVLTVTFRGVQQRLVCHHGKLPPKPYGVALGSRNDGAGVTVLEVSPSGLAQQAGLLPGSKLLTIDGLGISDPTQVATMLSTKRQGDASTISFLSGGQHHEAVVRH